MNEKQRATLDDSKHPYQNSYQTASKESTIRLSSEVLAALVRIGRFRGLGIGAMARAIGVAHPNLTAALGGRRPLPHRALTSLCTVLGIELLEGRIDLPDGTVQLWQAAAKDDPVQQILPAMHPQFDHRLLSPYVVRQADQGRWGEQEVSEFVYMQGQNLALFHRPRRAVVVVLPPGNTSPPIVRPASWPLMHSAGGRWIGEDLWRRLARGQASMDDVAHIVGPARPDWDLVVQSAVRSQIGPEEVLLALAANGVITGEVARWIDVEAAARNVALSPPLASALRKLIPLLDKPLLP